MNKNQKKRVLIVDTGGTFNKIYNPLNGELEVDVTNQALKSIFQSWMVDFEIVNILGKDSLDIDDKDRLSILKTVKESLFDEVIIIHGTDTMDKTAELLAENRLNKKIILTGSMKPFSINPIEATANFCSAYGFLVSNRESNIYISMNGQIGLYSKVVKNRKDGKFESC